MKHQLVLFLTACCLIPLTPIAASNTETSTHMLNQDTASHFSTAPNTPPSPNGDAGVLQAMQHTEEESQEALKVTYKDFSKDQENFNQSRENQANALTILRKNPH